MSTKAQMVLEEFKALPPDEQRQVSDLILRLTGAPSAPLTLREAAEMRGKLAAWEEDWNAPGMEVYDRP